MIENNIQPKKLCVNEDIQLVKYYPNYKVTLPWYSDPVLCKQVDNIDFIYDLSRLKRMYSYLCKNGECYYIKYRDGGKWRLVGDISLHSGSVSVVVCREYQNRHIGRNALSVIIDRARMLGYTQLEAEIYSFNTQSRRMFESAGFRNVGAERFLLCI